jgi:arsenate reductase
MTIYKELEKTIASFSTDGITEKRKKILLSLIDFIQDKIDNDQDIRLNFICTHNSRRSHLSQVWAQTLAYFFSVKNVFCYSGGTEATALFPMAAKTLEKSGFKINILAGIQNPVHIIKYAYNEHPVIGFSKKFDDDFNPTAEFAAIMTCSDADENCPLVYGAEVRIPITFEDPKVFDHTPLQEEKYMERSLQIASELFYVFSQINK